MVGLGATGEGGKTFGSSICCNVKLPCSARLRELTIAGLNMPPHLGCTTFPFSSTNSTVGLQRSSVQPTRAISESISSRFLCRRRPRRRQRRPVPRCDGATWQNDDSALSPVRDLAQASLALTMTQTRMPVTVRVGPGPGPGSRVAAKRVNVARDRGSVGHDCVSARKTENSEARRRWHTRNSGRGGSFKPDSE